MVETKCSKCGSMVKRYRSQIKTLNFCNKSCHRSYKNLILNPSKFRDVSGENNPMFGRHPKAWNKGLIGNLSHNWKGGFTRKDGYKVIKIGQKKILEHRFILRSQLEDGNVVHHIDGNPSNNSLENLRVLKDQAEHARLHARERAYIN